MDAVERWLRWYEHNPGNALVGEARVQGITLAKLQRIFGVEQGNPMYDCWPVRQEHVVALQPHVVASIEIDRFAYFVEAESS